MESAKLVSTLLAQLVGGEASSASRTIGFSAWLSPYLSVGSRTRSATPHLITSGRKTRGQEGHGVAVAVGVAVEVGLEVAVAVGVLGAACTTILPRMVPPNAARPWLAHW